MKYLFVLALLCASVFCNAQIKGIPFERARPLCHVDGSIDNDKLLYIQPGMYTYVYAYSQDGIDAAFKRICRILRRNGITHPPDIRKDSIPSYLNDTTICTKLFEATRQGLEIFRGWYINDWIIIIAIDSTTVMVTINYIKPN